MDTPGLQVLDENLWEMHLTRQFNWTKGLRRMIYEKIALTTHRRILDCGCGIGLITRELAEISGGEVHGIDINGKLIKLAKEKYPGGKFEIGSLEKLPYEDNFFDVTLCHFVLMWLKNPVKGLEEMKRVTRPGGWIVCAAEPDYGAKIDYPDEYGAAAATIRQLMAEGSDPFYGRKLKANFSQAGLTPEMGVDAELWDDETMRCEFEHVWKFSDLAARSSMQKHWIQSIKMRDQEALDKGERITFLPKFWGIAKKEE